jgi:hypothetical protein
MTQAPIKVHFRRFYPRFDPQQFWIPLIEQALGAATRLSPATDADLVVTSVFESRSEMWKRRVLSRLTGPAIPSPPRLGSSAVRSIWVTGENIRPPADGYDLTFSFDLDDFGGSNVYLPLLLMELDWFSRERHQQPLGWSSRTGMSRLRPEEASQEREIEMSERPKFVCAFVGNAEPIRMKAISALERIGRVDVFGSAVGRPVASKAEIARDYRFMLCFENDLYPGYVTEKVLEAYQCGCIPLWRGVDAADLLNPKALINESEFPSLGAFVSHVADLNASELSLQRMSRQALFRHAPDLQEAVRAIQLLFDSQADSDF